MTMPLILGTRGSQLAVTQSQWFADVVRTSTGREVELVQITTAGDVIEGSLAALGGTGVFATALREALVEGTCDFIVHSFKDLPTTQFPGLTVASVPARERANDSLCSVGGVGLTELPAGTLVGTGSPRRAAQVRRACPDLKVADIRGNVDTRLAKVARGEYGAVILASAGLRRIGRFAEAAEEFDLSAWPTSAGQGALAVECRTTPADEALLSLLGSLTDAESLATSTLEREVLRQLEAGCSAPVGISARVEGGVVILIAEVYAKQPGESIRVQRHVEMAEVALPMAQERVAASVVSELVDHGLLRIAGIGPGTGSST